MNFCDSHIHNKGSEARGFIVGLEGQPWFDGILDNHEAQALADSSPAYHFFRYMKSADVAEGAEGVNYGLLLKYHPRREKYSAEMVISSIRACRPKAVMVDTLDEPEWSAYDYWKICRAFPSVTFILPHAGGYLINDFIKICHFQPNVWMDFALTHTQLGGISGNPLPYIDQAIVYALNAPFKNRILMGSDFPFFSQADVVQYYDRMNAIPLLNANFEHLEELITA